MPFPMKVQPLDAELFRESSMIRSDSPAKPRSRLKRLFDRQFHPRPLPEKAPAAGEFEPSSVCLDKLVQSFIEDSNEKHSKQLTRNRCNCFNGNNNDSSDDEFDDFGELVPIVDSSEILKSLIQCASKNERNLLADTSKIVEKNKTCKRKDDLRKIVSDALLLLGYDASICKSRWEKCPSYPAGEYEYIDVIIEGGGAGRVLIDIDFRSEFEIARSTSLYKSILQWVPSIFVGESNRLNQIVSIVSEAARQSLKKKGMHIPPWRKVEYMRAKWLSPHTRTENKTCPFPVNKGLDDSDDKSLSKSPFDDKTESEGGELELIFGEENVSLPEEEEKETPGDEEKPVITPWQPPEIKPKSGDKGSKVVVTGLASLLREKP